jgi:O-antigen ligase
MNTMVSTEWWRPEPAAAGGPEPRVVSSSQALSSGGTTAFRALMAFTFILLLAPQGFLPMLQPFRIALVAAVVGIGAHLVDRLAQGRPLTVTSREMSFAFALVTWSVVTVPLSYWPGGSTWFLLDMYVKTVAIFWLLANAVNTLPRLRQVAWALSLMAVPLALTGLKNFLEGDFIQAGHSVKRIVGYAGGLTTNPNDLALMLNLILPLTVALLLAMRSARTRAVLLVIALLQAACVVATFSRAGFLTLAMTCGLYLLRLVRRGQTVWAAAAVGLGLFGVLLLPPDYVSRMATITNVESDPTGSSQLRWTDTITALNYVAEHPLVGAGIGMNNLALNDARGSTWHLVHNVYLEYGMDLGLIGLALFLLLFLSCLKRVRSIRRETADVPNSRELSCLAEGIEMALVAFGVSAFFYPVAYQFYFYYLAGLAVAAGVIHHELVATGGAEQWTAGAS